MPLSIFGSQHVMRSAFEFQYVVDDGSHRADGTVAVQVVPVNDAPIALDDVVVATSGERIDVDVLANDSDVDGDRLSVVAVDDPSGAAAVVGTLVRVTVPTQGTTARFGYVVDDGNGGIAPAEIVVQIERPPRRRYRHD